MRTNFPTNNLGRTIDYEAIKANAFSDQGIVVAAVTDARLDEFERQFLKNIGRKLFGEAA